MNNQSTKPEKTSQTIESTIAMFRNFAPKEPVGDSVLYFWESHNDNLEDKPKTQAACDLIYKQFDVSSCEKYEVRTGYLSRYNYMKKPIEELSPEEIENSIKQGQTIQKKWLERCSPELPDFIKMEWENCVSKEKNRYFEECKELIIDKLKTNEEFSAAFEKTVLRYAEKHNNNKKNGELYVLEECSWILSLPLMHLSKPIYLIHVENDNPAIKELFRIFTNLSKALKWLSPRCVNVVFKNFADFLMYYRNNNDVGYSYAIENKDLVRPIFAFKKRSDLTKEGLIKTLKNEQDKKDILEFIIGKLPGHVYWLSRDNKYLGCNDAQAKAFGLNNRSEVIGKSNIDFHKVEEAKELDKINMEVMETEKSFEGEELASFSKNKHGGGTYLTKKTPLYNLHGDIVGLLGISMDITDRKTTERLIKEKEAQQIEINCQKKIAKVFENFVKNMDTSLTKLSSLAMNNKNLIEEERISIASETMGIKKIINELFLALEENSFERLIGG